MKYKQDLIDMHAEHSDWFTGGFIYETPASVINIAPRLRELIFNTSSEYILDFGCGKGHQYTIDKFDKYFGVTVDMYDPCVPGIDILQDKKYDGVICANVLNTIPEEELDEALDQIFSRAKKFVFIGVTDMALGKTYSDGNDICVNKKDESYWRAKVDQFNTNNVTVDLMFVEW